MDKPNIAVLGATGVVGREILKCIERINMPYENIKLLSSAKSAGTKVEFMGQTLTVEEAKPESFDNVNIVLASAGASTSKMFVDDIVKRGGVIVDNSSAFRMDEGVPLVIVGVNEEDLKQHKGIVANPNCSTSQLMPVLNPLNKKAKIKRMIVSTYQSVSGAGLAAINELKESTQASLNGEEYQNKKFVKNIGFNVIPQIDVFCDNGYTKEEMKVTNETRKILHLDKDLPISCTAVRVPVFRGHSEAVTVQFENPITPEEVKQILSQDENIIIMDDVDNNVFPTALDAAYKDPVYVGRIRKNIALENAIDLWCVADNLLIGAALNTVRIAKKLAEMKLY